MRKSQAFAAIGTTLALMSIGASAHVATISGCYDCRVYDTPSLAFNNSSGFDFTSVKIVLHGYQGKNAGITQSTSLADIGAGTTSYLDWLGPTTPGNLFAYDYDDEYGVYYNQVGNFDVTFTAKWNGLDVFSVFSPSSNASGGFVGWEGLDPDGYAETAYDVHSGDITGILAYIDIGTPPTAPEPASLALVGIALAGLEVARRVRRRS